MSTSPITIPRLRQMKRDGEKIAVLTCYDASFAKVLETAGVEVMLVGDSLGMVVQGRDSTLPVRIGDMVYHSRLVSRAQRRALVVTDMPFLSYASPEQALATAARLMKQGGAQMVKLEGGTEQLETVRRLTAASVPVCAHLGLLPQSVHKLGGYRVQAREPDAARRLQEDALALQEAGAGMLVLECIPARLAAEVSASLEIPVIGIGAGSDCDGQVLVLYDMLGITPGKRPSFVQDFLAGAGGVEQAVAAYVQAVKCGAFPTPEQSFS